MGAPEERALHVKHKSQGEKSWKIEVDEGGKYLKAYYCEKEVADQIEPGKQYSCIVMESKPYKTQWGEKTSWWINVVNPVNGTAKDAPKTAGNAPILQKVPPVPEVRLTPLAPPKIGDIATNRQIALLGAALAMFGQTGGTAVVTDLAKIYLDWLEGNEEKKQS